MKKYAIILFHVLIIISGICFVWKYNSNENIYKQNLKASQDTIRVLKMENGNLLYERDAYILRETELTSVLNYNSKEIRELKDKLGSIETITKIETIIETDTIYTPIASDFSFKLADPWFNVDGKVEDDKVIIHGISFPLTINTGFTKDNKVFVKTDNPYVNVIEFNGSQSPKVNVKHEVVVGLGLQYGLFNKSLDFGPSISYGFVIEF